MSKPIDLAPDRTLGLWAPQEEVGLAVRAMGVVESASSVVPGQVSAVLQIVLVKFVAVATAAVVVAAVAAAVAAGVVAAVVGSSAGAAAAAEVRVVHLAIAAELVKNSAGCSVWLEWRSGPLDRRQHPQINWTVLAQFYPPVSLKCTSLVKPGGHIQGSRQCCGPRRVIANRMNRYDGHKEGSRVCSVLKSILDT